MSLHGECTKYLCYFCLWDSKVNAQQRNFVFAYKTCQYESVETC